MAKTNRFEEMKGKLAAKKGKGSLADYAGMPAPKKGKK